jgi:two-component system OmpR family response regulator
MPHSKRILVAEDDLGVRELIRARLSAAGYDTHTAHDGGEALERIRNLRPDGVVLDINMPVLDGFAVLDFLKGEPRLRGIPVLVLTARHASDDVRRAVSLGAKDFLTKPFSDAQLMARVARLLRAPLATSSAHPVLLA